MSSTTVRPKRSLMEMFRRRKLISHAVKAVNAGEQKQRTDAVTKQQSSSKRQLNSELGSEFIAQSYTGPWAPSYESMQTNYNSETAVPLKKKYISRQASMSTKDKLVSWCEIKLAALRRSLDFTHTAEFIDADQHAIKTKLEMLDAVWAEYGNACCQCLSICNHSDSVSMEQGEEMYCTAKTALRSRLVLLTSPAAEHTNQSDNVFQIQWSDLPSQDKLPLFAGDFAKWASFRDAFIEEVHNNKKLTNAQRLRKLLAALEGPAKRAVGEWSVADDRNYHLAWSSLRQQYDNNHQTIRSHMQEISVLPSIRFQSFEDLRVVLDTVRVNRRHLLSLLSTEQLVDYQFLHQIEQLLDTEGRREWEMRRRVNELPTLTEMFTFLELFSTKIEKGTFSKIKIKAIKNTPIT